MKKRILTITAAVLVALAGFQCNPFRFGNGCVRVCFRKDAFEMGSFVHTRN